MSAGNLRTVMAIRTTSFASATILLGLTKYFSDDDIKLTEHLVSVYKLL